MPTVTPQAKSGRVSFGKQTAKESPATDYAAVMLTEFRPRPEIVRDEPEDEIGNASLDRAKAERFGHDGVSISMGGRFRPGPLGHLLQAFGMECNYGGFVLYDGVNEDISVTDDGGGPATVDILSGSSAVEGVAYTGTELAAFMETALNAARTPTYTVTYSTTTKKFTIAATGATLSLHWTTFPMNANLLGFDHSADDTGATSYEGDEAREAVGRHWFRDADNEVLRVTDDGGGPVDIDIISGDGAAAVARNAYSPWTVCALLKKALDGDTTLSQTYEVTYSGTTNKYTIGHGGATLSLHHSHANSTMSAELGFATTADDTGATSYTADNALVKASKALLRPYTSGEDFPWYSILSELDLSGTLDLRYEDFRCHTLTFEGGDKVPLRFTANGRCLDWQEASGGESVTAHPSGLGTPNTQDPAGHVRFGGGDYRIISSTWNLAWEEDVEPQQVQGKPYAIEPGLRTAGATFLVGLGAEDNAALYRKVFFGSDSGTEPSNTVVEQAVDVEYDSGTVVPGQTGATERYAWRFETDEAQLEDWPLEQDAANRLQADLDLNITRESDDWTIGLVGSFNYGDLH